MPTSKSFAYNTGSPISGTDQVGDLAISVDQLDYTTSPGGVQWWQGPDEDLGYVIAHTVPGNTQPTPVFGTTASVGFNRSTASTEAAFIEVANSVSGQVFASGNAASAWLTDNGYWNSWSSFGSSGFQWMTMTSITSSTAAGIGQNSITVAITQSGGGMETTTGMYNPTTFPEEYGVPFDGDQILNQNSGTFTATFSQPVTDALVGFASIGNPGTQVPIIVSAPFTPIWSTATTFQNPVNGTQYTQLTGTEGFCIIRIDGTVSSVTFNYTASEYYCNVCFGFVNQNP
jgi:hypothetical protein